MPSSDEKTTSAASKSAPRGQRRGPGVAALRAAAAKIESAEPDARARTWMTRIGRLLYRARKTAGVAQEKASELADVTQAYVSRMEHGASPRGPSVEMLLRYAEALGYDCEILLRDKNTGAVLDWVSTSELSMTTDEVQQQRAVRVPSPSNEWSSTESTAVTESDVPERTEEIRSASYTPQALVEARMRSGRRLVLDDAPLVQSAIAGDKKAFEALYRRYAQRVFGMVLRATRDREVAAEVTQEAFVTAWRRLPTLDTPDDFGFWIVRIAIGNVRGVLRRSSRQGVFSEDDLDTLASNAVSDESTSQSGRFMVDEHLGKLSHLLEGRAVR
jgi:DNA-directed RNA polymerase specialized sigma24 family protein/transcriptional regulator with XRE-family HTH domain